MEWVAFAFLSAASFTTFSILIRKSLLKGSDATAFTVLNDLTTGIMLLVLSLFVTLTISLTPHVILLTVISSMLFAFSSLLFTKARQIEEVGIVSVVRQTAVFWIFIGGILFYGEQFSLEKIIGTMLLFIGTWIVLWRKETFSLTKGVIFVLAGAIGLSISSLIAKDIVINNLSPILYSGTVFSLAGLWLLPFIKRKERLVDEVKLQKWRVIIVSIFLGLSVTLLYSGYSTGEVSKVFPVYSSYVIMSVIAGMLLLGEGKYMMRKILGSLVALVGVVLLVAF